MIIFAILFSAFFLAFFVPNKVDALGCMATICSSDPDARHPVNKIIRCASDGICGHYRALRRNDQFVEAVDLGCREGSPIYAPFDGELSPWRPFNGNGEGELERKEEAGAKKCKPDQGARIDGEGQWQGYHVLLASVRLFRYSGKVRAGQKIGRALDLECAAGGAFAASLGKRQQRPKRDENFVRVHLFREGQPIDATHHLIDCMCTGQICETNRLNALEGPPFKFDSRYNGVRGWELKCPDVQPAEATSSESFELADGPEEGEERTAPHIYSPIEGEVIGRIRVNSEPGAQSYSGCTNEGIFITGTGKWADYEVRLFNARFRESLGLGRQHIQQGQHIGYRLECAGTGEEVPSTVFMEVRFQGILLDITDAIMAKSCKHKELRNFIERFRI